MRKNAPLSWIKIDVLIRQNPKTRKFSQMLGADRRIGWAYFANLLLWAGVYAAEGNLSDICDDELAEICGWSGDAAALKDALLSSGLLESAGPDLVIHGWLDMVGSLLKRRGGGEKRPEETETEERTGNSALKGLENAGELETTGNKTPSENASLKNPVNNLLTTCQQPVTPRVRVRVRELYNKALVVYGHWATYHPKAKADPPDSVLKKCVAHLAEPRADGTRLTVADLCAVVDAYHADPWHREPSRSGLLNNFPYFFGVTSKGACRVDLGLGWAEAKRKKEKPQPSAQDVEAVEIAQASADCGLILSATELNELQKKKIKKQTWIDALTNMPLSDRVFRRVLQCL